jgi:putative ABC transport system permease protein
VWKWGLLVLLRRVGRRGKPRLYGKVIMIFELGRQAYNALRHNRRRSILTMLGMAWGIATVVLLLAYGSGFERGLWVAFRSWGTNLVFIFPGRTSLQAGGTKAGSEIKLTVNDLDYVEAEVPLLKRISPEAFKQSTVAFGTRSGSYGVSGVYPYYQHMRRMDVENGSFFTDSDENTRSRVAILGADVRKKLFSGQNAVGEKVRVDGISYEVIGVLKRVIQNGDDNMNGKVYIPFSAMSDLMNTHYLNAIAMEYEGDHEKVAEAVRRSMAFHHEFDPKDKRAIFVFDVFADLLDLRVITTGIKILLGFIGLLTLGIGGVGLMNIMLVSVTQRTREIGVEKALGARSWHILIQFLAEALVITLLGGLAGVVFAYLVSWSVGSLTLWSAFVENGTEGDIHLAIDATTLLASTMILGFVGVISGMLPAIKASRLDPIEALRYE